MRAAADFGRLLDVVLPGDGWIVAFAEVYMDESYDDSLSPPVLTVAGYLFRKQKAKEFTREWRAFLRLKRLPYFHANECAHGVGVFTGRTDNAEIEKKLIELIKRYSAFGFGVNVPMEDYRKRLPTLDGMPSSPYGFALFAAMTQVRKWTERQNFNGQIAYFFESGYRIGDANNFISWIFESERVRSNEKYRSHSFVPKETPALQSADLLAYLWHVESKRKNRPGRRPVRKDFLALIRPEDKLISYDAMTFAQLYSALAEAQRVREEVIRGVLAGERDIPKLERPRFGSTASAPELGAMAKRKPRVRQV